MKKLQLRNYGYSTRKPKDERRKSIEMAVLDHGKDIVVDYLKKIHNLHKILKEDYEEIEEYVDDVVYLKEAITCEDIYFKNKDVQEQVKKIYNMTKNYEKKMTQLQFGKATVKRNLKQTIKKIKIQCKLN